MSSPFAGPASAVGIKWADINGSLVLVDVKSHETGIQTAFGTSDAVRADVVVLDGPQQGTEYPDCLIFPKGLQAQLRPRTGQKVLGRVGQGAAKPGQSAPWLLTEATPADQQVGMQWLNQNQLTPPAASNGHQPPF